MKVLRRLRQDWVLYAMLSLPLLYFLSFTSFRCTA